MAEQALGMDVPRANPMNLTRNLSLVILLFAIVVSAYLSYLKVSNATPVCVSGGAFDCGTVLNSRYSEIGEVPIAWLGLGTNLVVVGLLLLERRIAFLAQYGVVMIFGVVLFAFIYSVYLVYIQVAVLQALCPWCLTHEVLIGVLFVISIWRLMQWQRASQTE